MAVVSDLEPTTMSGGDLEKAAAELASLEGQREAAHAALSSLAASAYQRYSARLAGAHSGVPLPADVASLAAELETLTAAHAHLAALQKAQAFLRQAEEACAHPAPATLGRAVDALAHAVRAAAGVVDDARLAAHTNTTPSSHEVLRALSNALAADLAHLSARLRRQLSAGFQAALGAAGWPPPFLSAGDEAGGAWRGLDSPDVRGAALQLTLLQRSAGEAAQNEGPWVAQELAAGVGAALRRHFASSSAPTDRADRPEWLLAITLRAARVCCAAAYQLQGVLAACFGGDGDDARLVPMLDVEVGRAILASALGPVLTGHVLPRLVLLGEPSLWLHLADELASFQERYAVLLGGPAHDPGAMSVDGLVPPAAAPAEAPLALLASDAAACAAWLAAERADVLAHMESLVAAPGAWLPVHSLLQGILDSEGEEEEECAAGATPGALRSGGGVLGMTGPHSPGSSPATAEFRPPLLADQVTTLVVAQLRRASLLHDAAHRAAYIESVTVPALRDCLASLERLLASAAAFDDLVGDLWRGRVTAAICAAHYLEYQLSEPQGVLLLAALQDGGAAPAHALAPRLRKVAAAFAALRRQWAYRLAKQAVGAFRARFNPYRQDRARFASGWAAGGGPGRAASDPGGQVPDADSAWPCPTLLAAADGVHGLLRMLSSDLDPPVFADVWRAVALAINQAFYNEVATEALFSPQGAWLFHADIGALTSIFGEWTANPDAHFKETREACRLLTLPRHEAGDLLAKLGGQGSRKGEPLATLSALNAQQALCVLGQRLDIGGS
uniref:RAD50-interacting protein 1 n=2 Tax=Auxenochlorella protothecoides TaxID=3075 RepID=A0A1D1ZRM1_AUXPR